MEHCDTCGIELTEDEAGQGRCDLCIEDQLESGVPGILNLRRAARARIRRQINEALLTLQIAGYKVCLGLDETKTGQGGPR